MSHTRLVFTSSPVPLPEWTTEDQEIATKEGWGLFERSSEGTYQIQRDDDTSQWSDHEAHIFVRQKADDGSLTHQKAIILHGTEC